MTRPAIDQQGTVAQGTADPGQQQVPPNAAAPLADDLLAGGSEQSFRVSMRGYDRAEVDGYRNRIESELASVRTAHEHAQQAHAQTSEQLRAAQTDLVRLRNQLTNSPTALSERLREILHLAEQDADQTRADAHAEADQIRADATADAEKVTQRANDEAGGIVNSALEEQRKLQAEAEKMQAAAQQHLDDTRSEATRLRNANQAEIQQAAAEAQQARERADAEATARRTEADREAHQQRERAYAAATMQLRNLSAQVAELTQHRDGLLHMLNQMHLALGNTLTHATKEAATEQPSGSAAPKAS